MDTKKLLIIAVVGIVILGALTYYMRRNAAGPAGAPAGPGGAPAAAAGNPCAGITDPVTMVRCRQAACVSAAMGVGSCACVNQYMPDPVLATTCCDKRGAGPECVPGAWLQQSPHG